MDIQDYIHILWRRRWIVLLSTLAAIIVVVVITGLMTPVYRAATTLRVAASSGGALNYTASTYSNQLIHTTARIATSRPILDELMTRLNLRERPVITADVISSTELIQITVDYSDPKLAAKIANTLADMLIVQSNELYTGGKISSQDVLAEQVSRYRTDLEKTRKEYEALLKLTPPAPEMASVKLEELQLKQRNFESLLLQYNDALYQQVIRTNMMTVVEEAVSPEAPAEPRPLYNYLLGFALGLFGGIVLAFIVDAFDSTLYSANAIEATAALPVLAKIPKSSKREIHAPHNSQSYLTEAFLKLAMHVILAQEQQSQKVLLILGAEPEQGKSTVAYHLARALAKYGKKIVAIDCDMRLPRLHELFHLSNKTGLKNILEKKLDPGTKLKHPCEGVSVITSGQPSDHPFQLLASPHMAAVIANLREQFDFVLLDTPALLAVSDTAAIIENMEMIKNVDAFMLVVRQSHVKRDSVQAASAFLKGFSDKYAGLIINYTEEVASYDYYRSETSKRVAGFKNRIQAKQKNSMVAIVKSWVQSVK